MRLIIDHECRILAPPPGLLPLLRQHLTIDNPKYLEAKRHGRWISKQLKAKLFFYREDQGSFIFPRGFSNEAIRLCRQFGNPEIILEDQRRLLAPQSFTFFAQLRPYQQEAVQVIGSHSFGVLEAGAGSGKTVMALALVAQRAQPTLILVHTKELLHQWRQRIAQFMDMEAGQAGDGKLIVRPLTVAIVHTARKHVQDLRPCFGHLIVDECHRAPASLFIDVVSAFDSHFMLGLSATAFRREDGMTRLIHFYLGDLRHRVAKSLLASSGAVLRPQLIQKQTNFEYLFDGDYSKLLQALTTDTERNRQIIADVLALEQQGAGSILLVSDRRAHCELLAQALSAHGVSTALLTGQTAAEERLAIVAQLDRGELQVLVATLQLIGEGFDCPGLSSLVLATPIKFEGRLVQVAGRIMRPARGKEPRIIDYLDARVPVLRRSAEARKQIFLAL